MEKDRGLPFRESKKASLPRIAFISTNLKTTHEKEEKMKKLFFFAALFGLVFMLGCAGELVYVKDAKLFKVADDGSNNVAITVQPVPATGDYYHHPDVNHKGDMVAFVSNTYEGITMGSIWTMKIDGTSPKQITRLEPPPAPPTDFYPKWFPDNRPSIAYWGKCADDTFAICTISTDLGGGPARGVKICDTNVFDSSGFDFIQSPSGPLRIIYSHKPALNQPRRLYQRNFEVVPTCSGSPTEINPFLPPGVAPDDLAEAHPAISFAQGMIASAVEWPPNVVGIRIRGVDQYGTIGAPLTFQFQGFERIMYISFADNDKGIYFSAIPTGGDSKLYYVSLSGFLQAIRDWITNPPASLPFPPPVVTPQPIDVGAGKSSHPSGVKNP